MMKWVANGITQFVTFEEYIQRYNNKTTSKSDLAIINATCMVKTLSFWEYVFFNFFYLNPKS